MIVLDTPSTSSWATPQSVLAFAGQDQSWVAQGDAQITAAKTLASVSGETMSVYTHTGGIQVIAANAPVSLRAHTDQLQLQADGEVTVISVDDEIKVLAATKVEFVAGQSKITLDGGDITFACPGSFTVKAGSHGWRGPGSGAAQIDALPAGAVMLQPPEHSLFVKYDEQFRLVMPDEETPMANQAYRIVAGNGRIWEGVTDGDGLTMRVTTESALQNSSKRRE